MTALPYRTGLSSLSDGELIILDCLFDCRCEFRLLCNSHFKPQWNLPYSHNLDDEALRTTLASLCERGILASEKARGRIVFGMTPAGGEIWSSERRPNWDRFCTERYAETIRGRTMMTVIAVSPTIRDDFLHYWPIYPARRKTATIADFGLVPWRPFERLHIGIACYAEKREWTPEESAVDTELQAKHRATLAVNRSWWRFVGELQRFIEDAA